jgi:hypothetical protein
MSINNRVLEFTKDEIKKGLNLLPQKNVDFFFRMYDHKGKHKLNLESLLNDLEFNQLNNALNQVEKTISNNG